MVMPSIPGCTDHQINSTDKDDHPSFIRQPGNYRFELTIAADTEMMDPSQINMKTG